MAFKEEKIGVLEIGGICLDREQIFRVEVWFLRLGVVFILCDDWKIWAHLLFIALKVDAFKHTGICFAIQIKVALYAQTASLTDK